MCFLTIYLSSFSLFPLLSSLLFSYPLFSLFFAFLSHILFSFSLFSLDCSLGLNPLSGFDGQGRLRCEPYQGSRSRCDEVLSLSLSLPPSLSLVIFFDTPTLSLLLSPFFPPTPPLLSSFLLFSLYQ